MNPFFNDLFELARKIYGESSAVLNENLEYFTLQAGDQTLAFIGDDETNIMIRTEIGSLSGIKRRAELFEELLQGNFFWQATDGAVISIGEADGEEKIWLTERIPASAVAELDAFQQRCEEFTNTARLWCDRIELYQTQNESDFNINQILDMKRV